MKKLYLIRGLPGSAKSSLAKMLVDASIRRGNPMAHFEGDDWFTNDGKYGFDHSQLPEAHKSCQQRTLFYLRNGHDVVVANTFTRNRDIFPYLEMAIETHAQVVIYECPNEFGDVHGVPADVRQRMKASWEVLDIRAVNTANALTTQWRKENPECLNN
jgi:predicted kinase